MRTFNEARFPDKADTHKKDMLLLKEDSMFIVGNVQGQEILKYIIFHIPRGL